MTTARTTPPHTAASAKPHPLAEAQARCRQLALHLLEVRGRAVACGVPTVAFDVGTLNNMVDALLASVVEIECSIAGQPAPVHPPAHPPTHQHPAPTPVPAPKPSPAPAPAPSSAPDLQSVVEALVQSEWQKIQLSVQQTQHTQQVSHVAAGPFPHHQHPQQPGGHASGA